VAQQNDLLLLGVHQSALEPPVELGCAVLGDVGEVALDDALEKVKEKTACPIVDADDRTLEGLRQEVGHGLDLARAYAVDDEPRLVVGRARVLDERRVRVRHARALKVLSLGLEDGVRKAERDKEEQAGTEDEACEDRGGADERAEQEDDLERDAAVGAFAGRSRRRDTLGDADR
jgi:hypothetical protein